MCDHHAVEHDEAKARTQRHREDETGDDGLTPWRTEGLPKKRRREPPEWWRTWRWVVLAVLLILNIWVVNVLLAPEDTRVTVSYNVFVDELEARATSPRSSRVATRSMDPSSGRCAWPTARPR